MTDNISAKIEEVLLSEVTKFSELVKLAELDPSQDFRFSDLTNADFSDCDLSGFNFSGSVVKNCNFNGAKISNCKFDVSLEVLEQIRTAADYKSLFLFPNISPVKHGFWDAPFDILFLGASGDSQELVGWALKEVGNVDQFHNGFTALMIACCFDSEKAAKQLLKAGADFNLRTENGETALSLAAKYESRRVANTLEKFGGRVVFEKSGTERIDNAGQKEAEPVIKDHSSNENEEVVLLFEEEAPVRAFGTRALRLRGYTVLPASTVLEVLDILDKNPFSIDILIIGLEPSTHDDLSRIRKALAYQQHVRLVFVSSAMSESTSTETALFPNAIFISKGFSGAEFQTAIQM